MNRLTRSAVEANSWLRERNRGFHVTIRDVDCRDFDVPRFIDDLASMHATFFSFFLGGYVTTYPTRLPYQRMSPYLDGRDLAGEIITAAHDAGLKALGMIDLGQIPDNAARDHPGWCAQDREGNPLPRMPGLYAACPMGGFQTTYIHEVLSEILERYGAGSGRRLDCIKFGGGSFGFSHEVCYCPSCQASFQAEAGHDLPLWRDWSQSLWRTYTAWRLDHARQRVQQLGQAVHRVDPEMPFMGNSVCFGDPGWTVGASLDVESQAAVADAVQVEIQTRARYSEETGSASWQWISWPAETARFMTSVSDTPIWVVTSYFLAWPWRRSAMAPVEQKVYLAQVAANGADPMVNLSGGPPAVHEDPRGFDVIRELYGFLAQHREFYERDASGATVALVYSMETLFFYGQDHPEARYLHEFRGIEQALHQAHIPFDIISTRLGPEGQLDPESLERYSVLVLPNLACLTDEEALAVQKYVENGGSVVATFETSLCHRDGLRRDEFALADLLGTAYAGASPSSMASIETGYKQVYMDLEPEGQGVRHPLLEGFEGTSLLPMGGNYCIVTHAPDATVATTLSAPFVVFPEGWSYPRVEASGHDLLVVKEHAGGGRTVYFAGAPGALYWAMPYPDLARLITNAVIWAADGLQPVYVTAPPTLQVSLRVQADRRLVHLINLTGGERFFRELVPVRDVRVALPLDAGVEVIEAYLLSDQQPLEVTHDNQLWSVTVPEIRDYDVLLFELTGSEV
jgi:hypothetical protein